MATLLFSARRIKLIRFSIRLRLRASWTFSGYSVHMASLCIQGRRRLELQNKCSMISTSELEHGTAHLDLAGFVFRLQLSCILPPFLACVVSKDLGFASGARISCIVIGWKGNASEWKGHMIVGCCEYPFERILEYKSLLQSIQASIPVCRESHDI